MAAEAVLPFTAMGAAKRATCSNHDAEGAYCRAWAFRKGHAPPSSAGVVKPDPTGADGVLRLDPSDSFCGACPFHRDVAGRYRALTPLGLDPQDPLVVWRGGGDVRQRSAAPTSGKKPV